jgi:alkylation response protein AidB-like acyl-CoA dehydrogenase
MDQAEQQQLMHDVEAFCEEIRPVEDICYLEHRFNEQAIPLARKHNLLGMLVPKLFGGREADAVSYAKALARIGREGTGVRTLFSGHSSIGQMPVISWGTDEQKRRFLPPSVTGDNIMAFGLTEPDAGSNPLELKMTYRRDGDRFLLNGVKYLISNGTIAHSIVTFAYPETGTATSPSPPQGERGSGGEGQLRMSAFVVETNQPGIEREQLVAKMGMPTCDTAMFELVDYPVPIANLLGEEGNGFRIAMHTLVSGRLSVAAGCLGVIEDCLQEAITYARERIQHGKPIAKHQLVQDHIAKIEIARQTTECIVLAAAEAKAASNANPTDAEVGRRADLLVAEAKYFAANSAWEAADHAVQVLGGRGFSDLYRPARHLKDSRVCRIYEGTDEVIKLKIAAAVLGKEYEAFR